MDAKHSADMFKHLEKQSEVLMESYRAMSHELHGLQVEEEMLMHKLYELMFAEGLIKKEEETKDSCQVDTHKEKDKDLCQVDAHKEKDKDLCQVDAHKEKEKDSDEEYILPQEDTSSSED